MLSDSSLSFAGTLTVALNARPTAFFVRIGVFSRVLMPLRTVSFGFVHQADMGSVGYGVGHILFWRSVGQIGKMVIERVAVKMSNSRPCSPLWTGADKGQGHEMMDHLVALPGSDLKIFTSMPLRTHVNREVTASRPPATTRTDHPSPFLVNEVSRESWDFAESVQVRHDANNTMKIAA